MGFDEEYGRLRAEAAERQTSSTRLNGTGDSPLLPGPTKDFASTPAQKTAAANVIHNELLKNTQAASDKPDEATNNAIKGFAGWDTAAGLKKVKETWESQVRTLKGRLSAEEAALRGTSNRFQLNDVDTGLSFAPASRSKLGEVR
ncbi:hypothetical protein [Streptomyces sp. CB03238]|uniref:hypothetical protein n=1 Tax=Streptomyces sp. CB03238 TaxID=1907777 RepID=UPI000A101E52|nr:hypothetical protein [Streptomyces sp. CB03238]ORT54394.1 hypothetical protein BKD26_35590 [Streptomyces sp. CB03238]